MPEPSVFDARLADIDRRLRSIQSGLEPPVARRDAHADRDDLDAVAQAPHGGAEASHHAAADSPHAAAEPSHATAAEPSHATADGARIAADDSPDPAAPPRGPLPPPTSLRIAPTLDGLSPLGSSPLLNQLHDLRDAHERLLELHRELLSQYAEVLERRAADAASAALTAGPFADADALRAFQSALGALPGVAGVAVREYLGADRVALDVRLAAG